MKLGKAVKLVKIVELRMSHVDEHCEVCDTKGTCLTGGTSKAASVSILLEELGHEELIKLILAIKNKSVSVIVPPPMNCVDM